MTLLLLPNQLFPLKLLDLKEIRLIILIEEPRYFTDFKFHKLKIMYHRASMKKYAHDLNKKNIKCKYVEFNDVNLSFYLALNDKSTIYLNPIDHKLGAKLNKVIPNAVMKDNLNFLLSPVEIIENKSIFYKNNKYSHDSFYKFQRERLNILIRNNKPVGGRWSYDAENRKALPKDIVVPPVPKVKKDKYYKEALAYTEKYFSKNYGSVMEWNFPIDTKNSIAWLKDFIKNRLSDFGPYEDAVNTEHPFIFHSVLSPMMNIGILPDRMVVDMTNTYYEKHKSTIPIASYEGFIRQVIGWRNYVYAIYMLEPKMYSLNKLNHRRKINDSYWLGETHIKPVDMIILKIVRYGYAHHTERLMYLGNWMLLNQTDPKEVHRIFMEWTVDAYDWVMVPNIMGMSQYADGGKMMTRLYFSSSNYINLMSNFKKVKTDDWWKIWDAVYYSFIDKHLDMLQTNYAISRQTAHWKKKTKKEQDELLAIARKYQRDHR